MKKLKIDCGLESYQLGAFGTVRFNPADPGLLRRFLQVREKAGELEKTLEEDLDAAGEDPAVVLRLLEETDLEVKDLLSWAFGGENNFREIFKGVNLLAPAADGEPVLTEVLKVLLEPIRAGADRWASDQVAQAKEKAAQRRAAQC